MMIDVFGGVNSYFQMWSLYRFGIVLMVAIPLFVGLATVITPMQVGSTASPSPSGARGGGAARLADHRHLGSLRWRLGRLDGVSGDADAIDRPLGTGMVMVSIILGTICVATTVVSLRTSGMGLTKVPLFAWSMLVAAVSGSSPSRSPSPTSQSLHRPLRWRRLFVGAPSSTCTPAGMDSRPARGVCGRRSCSRYCRPIIPVVAKGRQVSHEAMMILIGLAGLLAIGGWSQPFFGDERDAGVHRLGVAALFPCSPRSAATAPRSSPAKRRSAFRPPT